MASHSPPTPPPRERALYPANLPREVPSAAPRPPPPPRATSRRGARSASPPRRAPPRRSATSPRSRRTRRRARSMLAPRNRRCATARWTTRTIQCGVVRDPFFVERKSNDARARRSVVEPSLAVSRKDDAAGNAKSDPGAVRARHERGPSPSSSASTVDSALPRARPSWARTRKGADRLAADRRERDGRDARRAAAPPPPPPPPKSGAGTAVPGAAPGRGTRGHGD